MKENIKPIGLKGNEINERIKNLMGITPINENRKNSVVELTKRGPDGNIYGIVRENHEYYIKIATKKENLTSEDFAYIGGLQNKKDAAYDSYAKAIKHLNFKFNSISEAFNVANDINVFQNDNLITESSESYYDAGAANDDSDENADEPDEALSETDQAVEDMVDEVKVPVVAPAKGQVKERHRLSIGIAINDMDSIIEGVVNPNKKKVYTLK